MNRAFFLLAALLLLLPASISSAGEGFPKDAFGGKVEVKADGTATFTYDFEDPSELKDWEGVMQGKDAGGEAWVADGVLEVQKTSKSFSFAYLRPVFNGDVSIEARARINAPKKKELLFRLFGPSNKQGYRIAMAYPMGGEMGSYIWKFPGEVLKKVQKPTLTPGQWYDVRIRVKNNSITVYLKNSLVLRVTDADHRKGQIGFGTFGSHVSFDSIRIEGRVDPDWLESHSSSRASAPVSGALSAPGEDDLLGGAPKEAIEGIRKGKEWYGLGNFVAAAKCFREAAGADRRNPLPLYFEGMALMAQNQPREAETVFGRAVGLRNDLPWIHLWRSRARCLAGDGSKESLEEAIEDLRRAIEADSRYVEAFRDLAGIYFTQKRLDEAVAAAQKSVRLLSTLQTESSGARADEYSLARTEAEKERNRFAWARDGLPLEPAREASSPFGKVHSDAATDDLRDLTRWLGSLTNGFRMIAGRAGVEGGVVYLIKDRGVFETYRFPGSSFMLEAGTFNPVTKDVVLFHGAGHKAWSEAAAELCARFLARDAGAAPWVEEGMARYFCAIPSDGDDRLKAGKLHEASAKRMLLAESTGNFTSLWKFVVLERGKFDKKADLHRAQSWSLFHFLRHGTQGRKDYFKGYFERLGNGKRGRELLGDMDWGELESAWKAHIRSFRR